MTEVKWNASYGEFTTDYDGRHKLRVYDKNKNYMGYRKVEPYRLDEEYETIGNIKTLESFLNYFNLGDAIMSDNLKTLYDYLIANNYKVANEEEVLNDNWLFTMGDKYILLP